MLRQNQRFRAEGCGQTLRTWGKWQDNLIPRAGNYRQAELSTQTTAGFRLACLAHQKPWKFSPQPCGIKIEKTREQFSGFYNIFSAHLTKLI